jgi:hypothetical protein
MSPPLFLMAMVICVLIVFGFLRLRTFVIKKRETDFQPHIILTRRSPNVDRVDKNREFYEKDSYLAKYLSSKRELIYFDVTNIPPKKDKEKSTARDVSYWIEVHDYDQERLKYKEYRAKWVPSNTETIDIIPDQFNRRVGLAFTDGYGNLVLLDSSAHYDENGMGPQLDTLYYGKFVFVAHISTSNEIYDDSPLYFLVENVREGAPKIIKMEDGEIWVKKVKQASDDIWKNLIKENKKKK